MNILGILAITIPIFMYVIMGYVLKQKKIINDDVRNFLSKLVYYFAFPMLTLRSILAFDFSKGFDYGLVVVNLLVALIVFAVTLIFAFFIRDKRKRGAFHMSCFRSNQGYMGLPVVLGFFAQDGLSKASIINAFDTPFAIILSVIALEIFRGTVRNTERKGFIAKLTNFRLTLGEKMIAIIKNPFVITSIIGLALGYLGLGIPLLKIGIVDQFLSIATGMALPLALISIGCSIEIRHLMKNIGLVIKASFVKLIAMPALALILAYMFGFRGANLGILVILSAMPSSVSSYVMALEMDADEELSAATIGVSTLVSVVTITLIQYFMQANFQVQA